MDEWKLPSSGQYNFELIVDLLNTYRDNKWIDKKTGDPNVINYALAYILKDNPTWKDVYAWIVERYTPPTELPLGAELDETAGHDPYLIAEKADANLKRIVPTIWDGFLEALLKGIDKIWKFISIEVLGYDRDRLDKFLLKMQSLELLDSESVQGIQNLLNTFPKGQLWLTLVTILSLIKTFIAVFVSAVGGTLMKKLNSQHTPNSPDPGSVLRAAFLDESLSPEVRRIMAENGLSKEDQDLMFISQYTPLDPDTVRQLYLRGLIPESQMLHRLTELGYTPERIEELTKLFDVLPPIQDISTMMTKEAFEEDQIAIMGLDRELPQSFIEYAGQHGLSKEWARRYWIMHWQQPGIQLMFQAYQRRFITEDDLKVFMKTIEIPPYLRDVMIKVAYNPLTRVDVRRMYEDGVLDIDQVYAAYLDHGYSPENATLMTQWTIRYAEPNEKELSRAQITDLMIEGHISRVDALSMLQKLGYPEHRANLLITYAEYKEIKDDIDEAINNVGVYFQNNIITKDEARQQLNNLAVPSNRVSLLIERWMIKNISETKLPSKTDLDKFYRKGIIDDNSYMQEMYKLGYSNKYIGWYLANLKEG